MQGSALVKSGQFLVKSRYLGRLLQRQVTLDADQHSFLLSYPGEGTGKRIEFGEISRVVKQQIDGNWWVIVTAGDRTYEITNKNTDSVIQLERMLSSCLKFRSIKTIVQQKLVKIKNINYQLLQAVSSEKDIQRASYDERASLPKETAIQTYQSYLKIQDWRRDRQKGGLCFINDAKKASHLSIVTYVISRIITKGSFSGVSFPVFAMKPETTLQTYCRCLSLAPVLLSHQVTRLDRIKGMIALAMSFSLRFIDLDKPFNPTIGQTYQALIGEHIICAEQVSHHPPVSAVFLKTDQFQLTATLELSAVLGFNTARGVFFGMLRVQFKDGQIFESTIPSGTLSGILGGKMCFQPDGSCFAHQVDHNYVGSHTVVTRDQLRGAIGELTTEAHTNFLARLTDRGKTFEEFKHLVESQFAVIDSRIQIVWSKRVAFDGKNLLDYENPNKRPPKLNEMPLIKVLPSNSRNRKDIELRKNNQIEQSQNQKEALQERERNWAALRKAQAEKRDQ